MQITQKENEFVKNFEINVQSYTLLLAEVFENFRNMCLEIYKVDHAHSLTTTGLPW